MKGNKTKDIGSESRLQPVSDSALPRTDGTSLFTLPKTRGEEILGRGRAVRILIVGDVMLDQFIWGRVARISPEAPVPVVDFERESFMPGGAANVARNLSSLGVKAALFGLIGPDDAGRNLRGLLEEQNVDCEGVVEDKDRLTSIKTRIVAHQQQLVRVDRETRGEIDESCTRRLLASLELAIMKADAVIVGDYGKGVVTQKLLDELKRFCRARGVWLSVDPKPTHALDLSALSLLTPNRKEAYELAAAAFDRYGRGRGHPAQLNFGDCMAYAVAKAHGVPLLYKGDDFARTDVASAA